MAAVRQVTLGDLEAMRIDLVDETSTETTGFPEGQWEFADGVLRHARAPFFEVAGFVTPEKAERLLLVQHETAIAGLLTAQADGQRYFLLNARCEPGLHGLCQFSTTVQSTPSNYLRRHSGAATPHIEYFIEPQPGARLLHDSMQYDWGQFYLHKRKRFIMIELDEMVAASGSLVWVAETVVRELMLQSYTVTSDLRCALALLWSSSSEQESADAERSAADPRPLRQVGLHELSDWVIDDEGLRERVPDQGVSIEYVRTSSPSREVATWTQPLMRVAEPNRVRLWVRHGVGGREVAVARRTQIALGGRELLFAAQYEGEGTVLAQVSTSAEGGRFMLHRVDLELVALGDSEEIDGATWLAESALARVLCTAEATSVELRLAASLLSLRG